MSRNISHGPSPPASLGLGLSLLISSLLLEPGPELRPELAGGQVRTGEVLVLVLGLAAPLHSALSQSLSLLIGLEVMAELGGEGENCLAEEVGGQI